MGSTSIKGVLSVAMKADNATAQPELERVDSKRLLALGGVGALVTSTCCVLPFVLVTLDLGGAWLAYLHALYPFRWLFIGLGSVSLAIAWRRLYRARSDCDDGELCANPAVRRRYRTLFWIVTGLLALSAVAPYLLAAWLT
ncbi:MAG: mercuric transporter MerT family protein [Wenzhouxiangellaceae bacterium]